MIFPDSVTIFEMVEDVDECGVDGHGKPRTCPIQIWEGKGMFQDKEPSETTISSGNIPQGDANLFLPLNALITKSSKVKVNDDLEIYQVVGKPSKRKLIGFINVVLTLEG